MRKHPFQLPTASFRAVFTERVHLEDPRERGTCTLGKLLEGVSRIARTENIIRGANAIQIGGFEDTRIRGSREVKGLKSGGCKYYRA